MKKKNNYFFTTDIEKYKDQIKNYRNSFEQKDKLRGASRLDEFEDIDEWVNWVLENKKGSEEYVPFEQYLLIDSENNNAIIGMVQLRLELNDFLLSVGGNIGYSVAPHYRKQGYGKILLVEALKESKKHNLDKILITCIDDNVASEKIILSQGGFLENTVDYVHNGTKYKFKRHWITIK